MRLLSSFLCGVLLFGAALSASAQTVISRNNLFDDLDQAEKSDMTMMATRGKSDALTGFKGVVATDEAVLLQVLRPVFSGNRWVDCPQAKTALAKGISSVSTTTGLIAVMTTGMRMDALQCGATGIPSWTAGLPQALLNIQGRLPADFGQTRLRLSRATPDQVIQAARARVFANPDVACMAPLMFQSRQRGEAFQDAQRKAVAQCVRGRAH